MTLVLFAGIALLFMARYPRGLFDLVLGLDRWVVRVVAYAGLMTDAYPPFRLDLGGDDPAGWTLAAEAPTAPEAVAAPEEPPQRRNHCGTAPAPSARRSGSRRPHHRGSHHCAALARAARERHDLVVVDQTQRDDDGFLMSPTQDFASPTYAIVSESADIDSSGGEWALDTFLEPFASAAKATPAVRRHRAGSGSRSLSGRRRARPRRRSRLEWRPGVRSTAGRRAVGEPQA